MEDLNENDNKLQKMAEELEVEQQAVQNREADTDTTLPTGKDDGWIDE